MSVVFPAARCAMTRSRMSSSRARSTVPPQGLAAAAGHSGRSWAGSRSDPVIRRSPTLAVIVCQAAGPKRWRPAVRPPGSRPAMGSGGAAPGVDSVEAGEDLVAPAGERVEHGLLRCAHRAELEVVDAELLVASELFDDVGGVALRVDPHGGGAPP